MGKSSLELKDWLPSIIVVLGSILVTGMTIILGHLIAHRKDAQKAEVDVNLGLLTESSSIRKDLMHRIEDVQTYLDKKETQCTKLREELDCMTRKKHLLALEVMSLRSKLSCSELLISQLTIDKGNYHVAITKCQITDGEL